MKLQEERLKMLIVSCDGVLSQWCILKETIPQWNRNVNAVYVKMCSSTNAVQRKKFLKLKDYFRKEKINKSQALS